MVKFLKGWDHSYSKNLTQPFEKWTIWNPIFKKFGFQMFPDFEWLDFKSPLIIK